LTLFGRRLSERGDGLGIPASENLHNTGSDATHSITSTALASNAGGTINPRAFAVRKLIVRENVVG
jgi:hypothetical protein